MGLRRLPVQIQGHLPRALVAHLEGILDHDRVDHARPHVVDQCLRGIEAYDLDLAGETALLDGLHRAVDARFVVCEEPGQVGVGRHQVLGFGQGLGAISHVELDGDDFDIRVLLLHRLDEPRFALHRGSAAGHEADHADLAPAVKDLGHAVGRHDPAKVVVGHYERDDLVRVDGRIEDRDRYAAIRGALDDRDQRLGIHWRQHDTVGLAGDEVLDDGDLTRRIDFHLGRVPLDVELELAARLDRARMDRLPECVVRALGDNADDGHSLLVRTTADGAQTGTGRQ